MPSKHFAHHTHQRTNPHAAVYSGDDLIVDLRLEEFQARLAPLMTKRTVRRVITRSGALCRGRFPSIKVPHGARYESLLERDAWRIFEVAPSVRLVRTHPYVLALPGASALHYTPDACIEGQDTAALVETKARFFMRLPEHKQRLKEVIHRLKRHGLTLIVMDESDIRPDGLQQELEELLRLRPLVGRYRNTIDAAAWDPVGGASPGDAIERRWRDAKKVCDDLLQRVMRRDPDEFIDQAH